MCIYNDCKIVIDLNKLVKARPCGVDLDDEHVDNIANDLRRRMTFDSLFEQVDRAIWDYAQECGIDLSDSEECQAFGFHIPQYGDIQPKPSEFDIVKLKGSNDAWTIDVPVSYTHLTLPTTTYV